MPAISSASSRSPRGPRRFSRPVGTVSCTSARAYDVRGHLADTVGYRPVVVGAMVALLPLTLTILLPFAGPAALIALLAAVGIAMDGNFSTTVTLAQDFLPRRVGLASGVVVGLSVGIGAVVTALLGVLADGARLTSVLWAVVGLAALSLGLALAVPLRPAALPALAS